jgi:hypothetical protein
MKNDKVRNKLLELGQNPDDLESIKSWLLTKRFYLDIRPIDSWDSWTYIILAEDLMAPFFEIKPDGDQEWGTYKNALNAAIEHVIFEFFIDPTVEFKLMFYRDSGKFYCEETVFVPRLLDGYNGEIEDLIFGEHKNLRKN